MSKRNYVLVFIVFLLASNVLTFYFFASDEIREKEFNGTYPLLNPARALYEQKDLIVNLQTLREQLIDVGKNPDVSVYFEMLNTGANISVNKDLQIWPASLMKIPIAMAVMKKIENGQWKMDKDFVLGDKDKNPVFSNLYEKPTGTHFKLRELFDALLIDSDNTARNMLASQLKDEELADVLDYLGIEFDYKHDGQITAKRYSIIWRSFFSSTYLEPENSEKLIEIMTRSSATNFLAKGVPDNVKFSHKIGVLYDENIYADSGIVYVPNRPYILTVMIKGQGQQEAENIMKDISEKAYKYVSEFEN